MPLAPDLAVEVISPTDKEANTAVKVGNYLAEKTTVWVVYPETESVHIFHPGKSVITLKIGDTLQDEALFPGFSLPIKDIFADQVDK